MAISNYRAGFCQNTDGLSRIISVQVPRRFWLCQFAMLIIYTALLPDSVFAETITATLSGGSGPIAVEINPVTNKTYVANSGSNTVTIIDGATNGTMTVPTGDEPTSIAVNPLTNKVYVSNEGSNSVTIIDGVTNSTTTVATGSLPFSVAVNPVTNKIYVANYGSNNITVVDGATDSTSTIAAGKEPFSIVVNSATNKIYVANFESNNVTVIDGVTVNETNIPVGLSPNALAVNQVTNKIYVSNGGSNNLTVIDGATNHTSSIMLSSGTRTVAVNEITNKIFAASQGEVTVIDGVSNSTSTVAVGLDPFSITLNLVTNRIYVANQFSGTVTIIDGATNNTSTLTTVEGPSGAAVNPVTNKIYIANIYSDQVIVIDGATNDTTTIAAGSEPWAIAVNSVTNKVYVGNSSSSNVTVIDGTNNSSTVVAAGELPQAIAVNPVTNKIYVGNWDSNTMTVIDGATNQTTTVAAAAGPENSSVAVNPVTDKIYVASDRYAIYVIDGVTNDVKSIPAPLGSWSVAVNSVTNKIYVADYYSNIVTIVDGDTNSTINLPVGSYPDSIAVNQVTNKIYVANQGSSTVSVIDGATNSVTTVAVGSYPGALAVNPITNKIYVANNGASSVTVIDGSTNSTATLATGPDPVSVAVNEVTNKIYVAGGSSVTIIDGTTQTTTTIAVAGGPSENLYSVSVAVNPVTNQVYVANNTSSDVTVVDEQQVQPIQLTTSITALPGNQATTLTPTFTFSASSNLGRPPDSVYFQVDTWQNAWIAATDNSPFFTGTVGPLQPGFHILYAFADDGQEAAPNQPGSPLTGAIQSYGFVVPQLALEPPTVVSLSPDSGSGATQTFTAVYSDSAGVADLANLEIIFNNEPNGTYACYVMYFEGSLFLRNDNGTTWSPAVAPGSAAQVSNSSCSLSGVGTSYTTSVNTATLNVALTFNAAFGGQKNVYLRAIGENGLSSAWDFEGTWGTSVGTPTVVSLTPSSGSSITQVFTATYSDPNGAADLSNVQVLLNNTTSGASACYVMYLDRYLYLSNDSGTGWSSPVTPGSSAQVSNSQCTLVGMASSFSIDGTVATLTASLAFSSSFGGQKNVYLRTTEKNGATSNWVQKGTWTPPALEAPTVVSLSPASGSGATQTFTAVYSDLAGVADLANLEIIFNSEPNEANACYVMYFENSLFLRNDSGTGWSAAVVPGSTMQVSNSACSLSGSGSSYTASTDMATLNVALTFNAAFGGQKNVYLRAISHTGLNSGWDLEGTWGTSVGTPSVVSLTPSAGSGSAQVFTATYSDPNGAADLSNVQILFNNTTSGASACYVMYLDRFLYLSKDSGTGWSSPVAPGSTTQVSNSQCTLSGTASSFSISSDIATLKASLTFSSSFGGPTNIYLRTTESNGTSSGWVQNGTWTP